MDLRLIRWRLPLSYAGIALLAALALGAVMLGVLRRYYGEREHAYLFLTAEGIRETLAQMGQPDNSNQELILQLASLAYISQARVRLMDVKGGLVFDSGVPAIPAIRVLRVDSPVPPAEMGTNPKILIWEKETLPLIGDPRLPSAKIGWAGGSAGADVITFTNRTAPVGEAASTNTITLMPGPATVYGFSFRTNLSQVGTRSNQSVSLPLNNAEGEVMGSVLVSDGPAYGAEIIASVAYAWGVAGGLAVLLAGASGWWISRRLIAPLAGLTAVTQRMAEGELSARAETYSRDEFGALGHAFNQMAERIEKTVLLLRQFASDAAHELQTPITALRTFLDVATESTEADKQVEATRLAQVQLERLARLTQDLLDLSRIETGSNTTIQTRFDLKVLASMVSELYAAQAEQRGVEFALHLPDESVYINGDEAQIRRVVSNLLENAVKFTPPGGRASLELTHDGAQALIRVEDDGIGIPAEDLPKIFERFHRGRNAGEYPGSGLGLAIARAIIDAHQGKISAENKRGDGARFEVTLPED